MSSFGNSPCSSSLLDKYRPFVDLTMDSVMAKKDIRLSCKSGWQGEQEDVGVPSDKKVG